MKVIFVHKHPQVIQFLHTSFHDICSLVLGTRLVTTCGGFIFRINNHNMHCNRVSQRILGNTSGEFPIQGLYTSSTGSDA